MRAPTLLSSFCTTITALNSGPTFSFKTDSWPFEPLSDNQPNAMILREHEEMSLIDFLNGEMPVFYTRDLSLVDGPSLLRAPAGDLNPFDAERIEAFDWRADNVDIAREFGLGSGGRQSIHGSSQAWWNAMSILSDRRRV